MHVYLAMDPANNRITMQEREFGSGDLPRGPEGRDWSFREADIDDEVYAGILAATIPGPEIDTIHRTLWTENGATPWPNP